MYRKLYGFFAVLVALTLVTSSSAMAMPGAPVEPAAPAGYRQSNAYPQHALTPNNRAQTSGGDGMVEAQAIGLGAPTAFRYSKTFGVSETAYFDDAQHINGATGLLVDANRNVYLVEEMGARLLKFAPDKTLLWQAGVAGMHDWGATGLNWPRELAFGPDGNIWVVDNDGVAWFDPQDGKYLGRFPEQPWEAPEFARFNELRGIAFDSAGRMFLSDRWRHRVQVFTTGGEIEFVATIGVTDQYGSDDAHFWEPGQIVVDSHDNLYVADIQNSRVQKCAPNAGFTAWECDTWTGTGERGGDENQFNFVYGLGIGANDRIYITDNANGRVKVCQEQEDTVTCSVIFTDLYWPTEVAVDPVSGNVFISTYDDFVVREFAYDTQWSLVRIFAGTLSVPYLTDGAHLNGPRAVETDSKGNVYVTEDWGQRLLKLDASGNLLWSKGTAGLSRNFDPDKFDTMASPTALALDSSGKKLAVAAGGWLIRFYDAAKGTYLGQLNRKEQNYSFDYVNGLAYDRSGNLYVSDRNRHVVRVYSKSGAYVRQLGVEYQQAPDNLHFAGPAGLATDSSGNLYVADHDNCRVQKFDKKGKFLMTFGTARCGGTYDRMGGPMDVAVDARGNVYVAEEWNSRVSVYSSKGLYLGNIGGEWSAKTGGLRNPTGVAVSSKGLVYVADMNNARVQRYALSVPYAAKVSQDNFGGRDSLMVFALAMFKGQLYAGTTATGPGAQIWRQTKAGWQAVTTDGFEDGGNQGIDHLYEYQGYLYASTYHCTNQECTTSNGGQIWRSPDGATWQPVTTDGFGDPNNYEIFRMNKFGGELCAATIDLSFQSALWCSTSGDPGTWVNKVPLGFEADGLPASIMSLQEYNGMYFAAGQTDVGAVMFRKIPTGSWSAINFPQGSNMVASDLAAYKGYLFAITHGKEGNTSQILRCKLCDGSDWARVDGGFGGNLNNRRMGALEATKSALYAVVGNTADGLSVWKSSDGVKWAQVGLYGLGSSNSGRVYWGNSVIAYGANLYLGTITQANGGAVWKICTSSSCK